MKIGRISFDPEEGRLGAPDGREIELPTQATAVLRVLVEASGRAVPKDQILSRAWPDILVGEDSLYQCICEIRRALDDDRHRILRNVPRKGYLLSIGPATSSIVAGPLAHEPIRFVWSGEVRLAWAAIGRGVPILKAPSWISNIETEASSRIFGPFYGRLGARARIVHFDQRGSSRSSRTVADWSVNAMVDDMVAVADAARLDRFFLFGPSQGGAFAIAFAARYPDRVLGIIARGGQA
jgi:DNA-binding winged helix-turn-helix (wHTH) protein